MSKYKPFPLFDGDVVWFQTSKGLKQGTLLKRPYGRRTFAIVRDGNRVLHYVASRQHIVRKVPASA